MLFLLGLILIVLILRDVFHSVVPRAMSTRFCIGPFLAHKIFWPPFVSVASKILSPAWKAEVLSLFAPFTLLMLLITWICLLAAGFGFITLALAAHYSPPIDSLVSAFYVSATSVFTIGSTAEFVPKTEAARFLMLGGAVIGLILTASVVSLMFGLISAIKPREALVSVIANLGGSPPSGIAILETHSRMHGREFLQALFEECHHWCADVLETHRAFPILPYFRSNDPLTSWLTVLGAVLDSIALMLSADPENDCFSARMTYQIGCKLVNEFASLFKLTLSEHEEIGDEEFHQLYLRLQSAGYASNSEEATMANFRLLRCEYLAAHKALSEYLAVPATPATGDNPSLFPSLKINPLKRAN